MNSLNSLLGKVGNVNTRIVTRNIKSSQVCLKGEQKINAVHNVSNLEKRFLVWTGKYKKIEDVPSLVPPDVMERSRNIMRIRISNIMIVLTLLGCIAMVWSGKKARQRGETLEQQNIIWHKIQEEGKSS